MYKCEACESQRKQRERFDRWDAGRPEWRCPECGGEGVYAELRKPFNRGIDACPECGIEVKEIEV